MLKLFKLTNLFTILLILSSCKSIENKKPKIINSPDLDQSEETISNKNKLEFKVSCGKGDLDKLLKDGWKIVKESREEKICSWKSYPASKDCNMEKDKGCKITKPDKIGEEKTYFLER